MLRSLVEACERSRQSGTTFCWFGEYLSGKHIIEEGLFTDLGSTVGSMLLGPSDTIDNVCFERGSNVMADARNIVDGAKIGVYESRMFLGGVERTVTAEIQRLHQTEDHVEEMVLGGLKNTTITVILGAKIDMLRSLLEACERVVQADALCKFREYLSEEHEIDEGVFIDLGLAVGRMLSVPLLSLIHI